MTHTYVLTTTGTVSTVEIPELKITLTDPQTLDLINDELLTIPKINTALSIQDSLNAGEITLTIDGIDSNIANLNNLISQYVSSSAFNLTHTGVLTVPAWLKRQGISTNYSPLISCFDSWIEGIAFSNKIDNADCDINVYRNGVLAMTWEVRGMRTAYIAFDIVSYPSLNLNDFCKLEAVPVSGGTNPEDLAVVVCYRYKNRKNGSGGNATI